MRALFLLCLVIASITPAFGMSTKDKVRVLLWANGIKGPQKAQAHVRTLPEEIERPLRKL